MQKCILDVRFVSDVHNSQNPKKRWNLGTPHSLLQRLKSGFFQIYYNGAAQKEPKRNEEKNFQKDFDIF